MVLPQGRQGVICSPGAGVALVECGEEGGGAQVHVGARVRRIAIVGRIVMAPHAWGGTIWSGIGVGQAAPMSSFLVFQALAKHPTCCWHATIRVQAVAIKKAMVCCCCADVFFMEDHENQREDERDPHRIVNASICLGGAYYVSFQSPDRSDVNFGWP
jgi:hypothetical protein